MIGMNHQTPPSTASPARLVVADAWYVRQPDGQVGEVGCRAYRTITDPDPQVYTRAVTLGPEWVEADLGFVSGRCGHLLLKNLGSPTPRSVQPTPDERAADEALVVEVSFGTVIIARASEIKAKHRTQWDTFSPAVEAVATHEPDLVVYPQHALRLPLHQGRQTVHLRAPTGPVRVELTAVPR